MRENPASRPIFSALLGLIGRALAVFVALLALYVAAGLVGGLIPVNRGAVPPDDAITVYIDDNGVHTGIIVPVAAEGIDWRTRVPASHLRDPRFGAHGWVMFGWGDRAFYLETPRWRDIKLSNVAAAAIGSDRTVVHASYVGDPARVPARRAVRVSREGYRRLAAHIEASFSRTETAPIPGYGRNDVFYPGTGRYSALNTCNEWTGAALRAAGVPMGAWTPFPVTVMWWL